MVSLGCLSLYVPPLVLAGHAIFLEDGTEIENRIERNLVVVVRPVWSLRLPRLGSQRLPPAIQY